MDRKTEKELLVRFNEILELRSKGVAIEKGVTLSDGTVLHNPVVKKVISPDKWKDKQIKRASAAADDWLEGVKSPRRDPIEAAKAAAAKWEDKLTAAIKEKRYEKGLAKTSHAEIVDVATKLGSTVFKDGIAARDKKIGRVVSEIQPLVQSVSDTIQAMPDKTDSDREKRLLAARKLMLEVGKKRRGV
jgi:MoxR-like ATPase